MESNLIESFIYLLVIHFTVMLSPGPLLFLVLDAGRQEHNYLKLTTVLGIVSATFTNVLLTLVGFMSFITVFPYMQIIIAILGAMYLVYLSIIKFHKIFSNKLCNLSHIKTKKEIVGFRHGYFMNLLNPKIAIFYTSIFSQIILKDSPPYSEYIFGTQMVIQSFLYWSTIVALASTGYVKFILTSQERNIDFICATVLLLFAFSMLYKVVL